MSETERILEEMTELVGLLRSSIRNWKHRFFQEQEKNRKLIKAGNKMERELRVHLCYSGPGGDKQVLSWQKAKENQ